MITRSRPMLLSVRIGKGGTYNKTACSNAFNSSLVSILRTIKVVYDQATEDWKTWNTVSDEADPEDTEELTLIGYEGNTYYVTETIAEIAGKINLCCEPVDNGGGGDRYTVILDPLTELACDFGQYLVYYNIVISNPHLFTNTTEITFDIVTPEFTNGVIQLDSVSPFYHMTGNTLVIDDSNNVPLLIKILLVIESSGYACDQDSLEGTIGVSDITNLSGVFTIDFNVAQFSYVPG